MDQRTNEFIRLQNYQLYVRQYVSYEIWIPSTYLLEVCCYCESLCGLPHLTVTKAPAAYENKMTKLFPDYHPYICHFSMANARRLWQTNGPKLFCNISKFLLKFFTQKREDITNKITNFFLISQASLIYMKRNINRKFLVSYGYASHGFFIKSQSKHLVKGVPKC